MVIFYLVKGGIDMKVRITSIFLAAAIMLSATGCSLNKNNGNLLNKDVFCLLLINKYKI